MSKNIDQQRILNEELLKAVLENDFEKIKKLYCPSGDAHGGEAEDLNPLIPQVDFADENGMTILHWAGIVGRGEVFSFLLKCRESGVAQPVNKDGKTADFLFGIHAKKAPKLSLVQWAISHDRNLLTTLFSNRDYVANWCKTEKSLLRFLIKNGYEEEAMMLVESGFSLKYRDEESRASELIFAVVSKMPNLARFMIEKGANLDDRDVGSADVCEWCALMIASLEDEEKRSEMETFFAEIMQKKYPKISKEEIVESKNYYVAKAILKLTYGLPNQYYFHFSADLCKIIDELLPKISISQERRSLIAGAFDIIRSGKPCSNNGKMVHRVVRSNVEHHYSYFVFVTEESDPSSFFVDYVDAGRFHRRHKDYTQNGVTRFKLDAGLNLDLLEERLKEIKDVGEEFDEYNRGKWFKDVKDFNLKYVGNYLPTQHQRKGNCAWKQLSLLSRVILELLWDKKVVMDVELGHPNGEGYLLHKDFKSSLIFYLADLVAEVARPENSNNVLFKDAQKFLEDNVLRVAKNKILAENSRDESGSKEFAASILKSIEEKCGIVPYPEINRSEFVSHIASRPKATPFYSRPLAPGLK